MVACKSTSPWAGKSLWALAPDHYDPLVRQLVLSNSDPSLSHRDLLQNCWSLIRIAPLNIYTKNVQFLFVWTDFFRPTKKTRSSFAFFSRHYVLYIIIVILITSLFRIWFEAKAEVAIEWSVYSILPEWPFIYEWSRFSGEQVNDTGDIMSGGKEGQRKTIF